MTRKGKNYSVKMQKYYFCNGTTFREHKSQCPINCSAVIPLISKIKEQTVW